MSMSSESHSACQSVVTVTLDLPLAVISVMSREAIGKGECLEQYLINLVRDSLNRSSLEDVFNQSLQK